MGWSSLNDNRMHSLVIGVKDQIRMEWGSEVETNSRECKKLGINFVNILFIMMVPKIGIRKL